MSSPAEIKNCNLFRTDKIGDDLRYAFANVAIVETLNEPCACRIDPLQEKMIALQLFAERSLLYAQAQFFGAARYPGVLILQFCAAPGFRRQTVSIS